MEEYGKVISKAIFSDEEKPTHRYLLKRIWDDLKKTATVIMLNPSYATSLKYDNSSMRVINYLVENGDYGGVYIVNLFSYIETDSENLPTYNERFNEETDKYIKYALSKSSDIYIGWGVNKNKKRRIKEIIKFLNDLNITKVRRFVDENNKSYHVSIMGKGMKHKVVDVNKIL